MLYKKFGNTELQISIFAMGGHEYLPDGHSRGFNEDFFSDFLKKDVSNFLFCTLYSAANWPWPCPEDMVSSTKKKNSTFYADIVYNRINECPAN